MASKFWMTEFGGMFDHHESMATCVRISCDYGAFPVWSDVKISPALRADFVAWAEIYDAILLFDYTHDENVWPTHLMPLDQWVVLGRSLAKRLKKEMGPDCEIDYLNEESHLWESI